MQIVSKGAAAGNVKTYVLEKNKKNILKCRLLEFYPVG